MRQANVRGSARGWAAISGSLLALMAWEQAPAAPAPRAAPLQAVFDCRRLTDAPLRLACYDRAAGALDAAESRGEVVTFDRAQVRQVRRQAFGFNMPTITLFQRGEKEETINRLSVTLTGARRGGDGKWVFSTAEDQVWRQTDDQDIFNPPHAGSTLNVRRAALGSFFCNVDGQLAVRCGRER